MQDPGAVVAGAFVAAVEGEGLTPDPSLRLLGWVPDAGPADTTVGDPFELGPLHERVVIGDDRVRRGAWYTPRWLAEDLAGRAYQVAAVPSGTLPRVADPACGGGVFLLAAAERLGRLHGPGRIIRSLWGCDVDPLAVAVTEAALWWWSARRGEPTVAADRVLVGDGLTSTSVPTSDLVIGNPPFLGQLRTATAADRDRRRALHERFGDAVRPYTDAAWLFLLAAVDAAADGGAVAIVQPSSVLGARDAGATRDRIDARATLVDTWIDDGSAFEASVEACAPVLRVGEGAANDWTGALSASRGIPEACLTGTATVAAVADVIAGFRDEYYGLVDAVREGGDGPALITSGAIDPLRLRDDVPIRFDKRRWAHPTLDIGGITGRALRWVTCQARAKLLVATQTRVLEGAVDPDGHLVGSVPVVVVAPHDPAQLWHLAAALHAPVVSAWIMRRSAGTALSNDACKPTARLLSDVPLPSRADAWDEAAELARAIADGADRWEEFAVVADLAYGVEDAGVRSWWLGRLPVR